MTFAILVFGVALVLLGIAVALSVGWRTSAQDSRAEALRMREKYLALKARHRDLRRERDAARLLVDRLLREKEESGWGPTRFQ